MKAWVRHLFDWAGRVGTDPKDSPETLLQKRLTVALCAGTLPLTIGWCLIYLAAGAPLAAAIPGFYSLFTPINTAVFAWARNLVVYRFTQLFLILLLPFLVMLALGGYRQSSAVILWAALCPLGSLLVEELRKTLPWIVGFVVLLVIGALLEPYLVPPGLPDDLVTWFFVLNLGAVVLVVFGLPYYLRGSAQLLRLACDLKGEANACSNTPRNEVSPPTSSDLTGSCRVDRVFGRHRRRD